MQTLVPVINKPDNYCADQQQFLLYCQQFDAKKLARFSAQIADLSLLAEWDIFDYHCVMMQHAQPQNYIELAHQYGFDLFVISGYPLLEKAGLLVMDMDSTAIQIECIDEVAKLAGTGEMVAAITESAMRGELDFKQSLRKRVGTLKVRRQPFWIKYAIIYRLCQV